MSARIRFHLDEHVSHDIARALAYRGIDVTTPVKAGLLGASDAEHLAFAQREGRVFVTRDVDFLRLANLGTPHAGIIFCGARHHAVGELVALLCLIYDCLTPEEMLGAVEYI